MNEQTIKRNELALEIKDNPTQSQLQHELLLPTPISPAPASMSSFIGQFSIKMPEKLYKCIECGLQFNKAHNLKSHKAVHSASKPYECPECQKSFLRSHDLKRHQKLHTGEKPYQCTTCSKSFSRLDSLNRHKRAEGACIKNNEQDQKQRQTPTLMESSEDTSEIDKLKQKIHDLEIENRLLRSLLEEATRKGPPKT